MVVKPAGQAYQYCYQNAQLLLSISKGSTKPSHISNQNATAKQLGKQSWRNASANVVDTGFTQSPTQSSRRQSNSPPVLAIILSTSSFTKTETLSLSLTLPSLATSICEICYDHANFTLGSPLLSRKVLPKLARVREGYLRGKNNDDRHQRNPNPSRQFSSTWCVRNARRTHSSSGRNTKVPQSAQNAAPPAKHSGARTLRRKPSLNILLIRCTFTFVFVKLTKATKIC